MLEYAARPRAGTRPASGTAMANGVACAGRHIMVNLPTGENAHT